MKIEDDRSSHRFLTQERQAELSTAPKNPHDLWVKWKIGIRENNTAKDFTKKVRGEQISIDFI